MKVIGVKSALLRRPLIAAAAIALAAGGAALAQNQTVLTIDEVRRRALEYNRDYLSAQEEINRADAEVAIARSGIFPDISGNAYYSRSFKVPTNFFEMNGETVALQFGFKNAFGAGVSLRQALFDGGRVFTALSIAKLYKKYSRAGSDEVRTEVSYNAEVFFYQAILRRSQLSVLESALEAANYNLETVEKLRGQGMVSEFEVLRARVERNNLLPQQIQAEAEVTLSEKRLKSFLGFDLETPVELVDPAMETDTSLTDLAPQQAYINAALAQRPAMQQAELLQEITRKAIRVAKSEYFPSLDAVGDYTWSANTDAFTLGTNNSRSLTAGLQLSVPIFQGGERQGEVARARVDYNQAQLAASKQRDDIRLQVEQAYSNLVQAKEALDIQGTNIEEAQEGLNIANVRYESGVGTLLEVLSAQAALTQARNARAGALFIFREARARLKRASMIQLDME